MPESIRACVPRDEGQDWTSLLSEAQALQAPLAFTDCGKDIVLSEDGAVASHPPEFHQQQPALVRSPEMRAGKHYAECTWISGQHLSFVRAFQTQTTFAQTSYTCVHSGRGGPRVQTGRKLRHLDVRGRAR